VRRSRTIAVLAALDPVRPDEMLRVTIYREIEI